MVRDVDEVPYYPSKFWGKDKIPLVVQANLREDAVYVAALVEPNTRLRRVRWTDCDRKVLGERLINKEMTVNVVELVAVGHGVLETAFRGQLFVYTANRVVAGWIKRKKVGKCKQKVFAEKLLVTCLAVCDGRGITVRFWDTEKFRGQRCPAAYPLPEGVIERRRKMEQKRRRKGRRG